MSSAIVTERVDNTAAPVLHSVTRTVLTVYQYVCPLGISNFEKPSPSLEPFPLAGFLIPAELVTVSPVQAFSAKYLYQSEDDGYQFLKLSTFPFLNWFATDWFGTCLALHSLHCKLQLYSISTLVVICRKIKNWKGCLESSGTLRRLFFAPKMQERERLCITRFACGSPTKKNPFDMASIHAWQALVKTHLPGGEAIRSALQSSARYFLRSYYEKEGGKCPSIATLCAKVEDDLDLQRGILSLDKVWTSPTL